MKIPYLLFATLGATIFVEIAPAFAQPKAPLQSDSQLVTLFQAGKFAAAARGLEARIAVEKSKTKKVALQNAFADVHFKWAEQLEENDDLVGAINHYQKALQSDKIFRPADTAIDFKSIGRAYWKASQPLRALEFYKQAVPVYRALGDKQGEATMLTNIGGAYDSLSQYLKALEFYNRALPIFRALGNKEGEAAALGNIGAAYWKSSQSAKALEFYNQALPLHRAVRDRQGEAVTLNNIGLAYNSLSQYAKALEFFNQALPIRRAVHDKRGEATTLSNIGLAYNSLSQYAKALEFFNQALPLRQHRP